MFFLASGERRERLCNMVNQRKGTHEKFYNKTWEKSYGNTYVKQEIYKRKRMIQRMKKLTNELKLTKVNFHYLLEGTVITL